MTMPEELPAPFPMSPSALPGDACDSLLNDSEQKYFSEFLDTFWGPEDTLSAPLEAVALYPEQRTSQSGHEYGQVAGSGTHNGSAGNQYGGSSSSAEWNQQRGGEGHYEPPPQHRPFVSALQIAEQHHESAHPAWHEQHAAQAPAAHHPPPQLYIQTSRSLPTASQQQSSSHSASSLPSANHGQPTPQTAVSSRHPLTDDTPSDEQDDSRSISPTDAPTDESPGAAQSARRGSASAKGSATKPRAKNMKRRNGRELLTEQEKRTNHIVSEQKRRTLIRSGFKALADLVPGANSSGNLGSSKSVILHNAVGFIRHLEYGNRALAEQLERLHKRYEMKMAAAAARGGGNVPMPQPPPPLPPALASSSPHPTATAHYTHHTPLPQQQQQQQQQLLSQPPSQNTMPATRPPSVSAVSAADADQFPHYPPDQLSHQQNHHQHQHHHRPRLDQQPPRTSPQVEPRQTPRRLASPSRA